MKKETFIKLIAGAIDQQQENNFIIEKIEEVFNVDGTISLGYNLAEEVIDILIDEFQADDAKAEIAIDVVFNEILAFKYNGNIFEATPENLFKLFNNEL